LFAGLLGSAPSWMGISANLLEIKGKLTSNLEIQGIFNLLTFLFLNEII